MCRPYSLQFIGLLSLHAFDLQKWDFCWALGTCPAIKSSESSPKVLLHSPSPKAMRLWGQIHIRPGKPQSWTCRFLQCRQVTRQTLPKKNVCQACFQKQAKQEKLPGFHTTGSSPEGSSLTCNWVLRLKEDGEQIRVLKDLINRSSSCESFTI